MLTSHEDDRGGKKEDYDNIVSLVRTMRRRFDERNPGWEISMAIPASYWYLQHFNLVELERDLSWFNLMRYGSHFLGKVFKLVLNSDRF